MVDRPSGARRWITRCRRQTSAAHGNVCEGSSKSRVAASSSAGRGASCHVDRQWSRGVLGRSRTGSEAVRDASDIEGSARSPLALWPTSTTGHPRREAKRMDRAGRMLGVGRQLPGQSRMPARPLSESAEDRGPCRQRPWHGGAPRRSIARMPTSSQRRRPRQPVRRSRGPHEFARAAVARILGLHGPSSTVATACAAGSDASGSAVSLIRSGAADAMFAGVQKLPSRLHLAAYKPSPHCPRARRPPEEASRPSTVTGTASSSARGAGIVTSRSETARSRGCTDPGRGGRLREHRDAGHLTQPDETGEGPAAAISSRWPTGIGRARRLRQRPQPRNVDAGRRPRRSPRAHGRRAGSRSRFVDQGVPREPPKRRHRGGRCPDAARPRATPELEPRRLGHRPRARLRHVISSTRGDGRRGGVELVRIRRPQRGFFVSSSAERRGRANG